MGGQGFWGMAWFICCRNEHENAQPVCGALFFPPFSPLPKRSHEIGD